MIYGANGYTGRLVARLAVDRGHRPILAGRDRGAVGALAHRLGLAHRHFSLTNPEGVRAGLAGVAAVLHCAGPFEVTSAPMVTGCLATGTHYLDVTGEITVLERAYRLDSDARRAGVVLLPAVGFDVVPTDCLAALLAAALPTAISLELAFVAGGGLSPGTFATSLRGLAAGNLRRVDGQLVGVPMGGPRRTVPLPSGPTQVTAIPWGDLASAWRSTGIPDITTYTRVSGAGAPARLASRAMRIGPVQALVRRLANPRGPDAARRAGSRSEVWGEVRAPDGETRSATLTAPNAYTLTADSALRAVLRVLDGSVPAGAHTPSAALGADFVRSLDGVSVSAVS
jgi:saccharopine dehydrogenase (NAD+, L-lysine-forming)